MENITDKDYIRLQESAKKCMRISALSVFAVLTVISAVICFLAWGT